MTRSDASPSFLDRVWGTLTSLRLTLVLLIILAVVGLIGTVRVQVFDTVWFLTPLGLFALNLTACLVRGLPRAGRRCLHRLTPREVLHLPERAHFTWPADRDPHARVERALRREVGPVQKFPEADQDLYLWERGRFRPLGPYVVHLALLLILAGALVGRFFGLEGRLTLVEGETAQKFAVSGENRPLPFKIRLDDFQVLYYPDGTPREFRSDLTFLKSGGDPEQAVCRVNDPVTFGGLTFYQSSYGDTVRLKVKKGENSRMVEVPVGQIVKLGGGQARFRILEYQPNLVMPVQGREKHLGPMARLAYWDGKSHPRLILALQNRPEMAAKQPGPYRFYLKGAKAFSVLQVKRDPGVWWVYLGFLLLLPGFYLAFLRPPERGALILRRTEKGAWEAHLRGVAPRSKEAFAARLERLRELLDKGGTA